MTKVTPISRTKCGLKGPVSGTLAGRATYHEEGAASIQRPFATLNTHKNQNRVCISISSSSPLAPMTMGVARDARRRWERHTKGASPSRLRVLTGVPLDMAWVARFAHQPHLVEEDAKTGERTRTTRCPAVSTRPRPRHRMPRLALSAGLASCMQRGSTGMHSTLFVTLPSVMFVRRVRTTTGHGIQPSHHGLLADNRARRTLPTYHASRHHGLQYGSP